MTARERLNRLRGEREGEEPFRRLPSTLSNYVWVDDTGDYLLLRPEHVLQEWEREILAACVDDWAFARERSMMGWGVQLRIQAWLPANLA